MMNIMRVPLRQDRYPPYNCVKEGIEETLKEVPAKKLSVEFRSLYVCGKKHRTEEEELASEREQMRQSILSI